ncbi:hypothetical protein GLOIN_2v1848312 [Rhizophagus irregularis DAOM 181602=DAOM 197198]|uniref:Uncharacterized protein n=2 Tax=Rhizophagus irregularis TaxID=588596 RepID=A0A2P4P1E9_RHIID|nr:hypothetical protein GLOIN_2v1848312 [Rhizophagus irregularis DAOM 181602=DAOM 197198]POG59201.1 hypothetical protein GLOIN_2v1848312 [Rhizophagus irregularis DAOM 181602=DAOM 197198]|eukprot:XP_025166067.1 hypothetical protein GLOIN_2v1848312 [Rhizophagus irregularis DAOM 181602=DAOM 197198]
MYEDIKDEETKNSIEDNLKSFLENIIVRDIKQTKEKLKLQEYDTFEKGFAIYFTNPLNFLAILIFGIGMDCCILFEKLDKFTFVIFGIVTLQNNIYDRSQSAQYVIKLALRAIGELLGVGSFEKEEILSTYSKSKISLTFHFFKPSNNCAAT